MFGHGKRPQLSAAQDCVVCWVARCQCLCPTHGLLTYGTCWLLSASMCCRLSLSKHGGVSLRREHMLISQGRTVSSQCAFCPVVASGHFGLATRIPILCQANRPRIVVQRRPSGRGASVRSLHVVAHGCRVSDLTPSLRAPPSAPLFVLKGVCAHASPSHATLSGLSHNPHCLCSRTFIVSARKACAASFVKHGQLPLLVSAVRGVCTCRSKWFLGRRTQGCFDICLPSCISSSVLSRIVIGILVCGASHRSLECTAPRL